MREIPAGHRVRYKHERAYYDKGPFAHIHDSYSLLPQGGKTIARIIDPEGNEIARGEAVCRPDENFKKAMGREIALGRALKQLEQQEAACPTS